MRSWWKSIGRLAAGLASLGAMVHSAAAQFPPPGGGYGIPPGGGMMGGMPPGGGYGMPPGRAPMDCPPPGAFAGNPNLGGRPAEFPNPGQPSQEPVSPFSIKDEGAPNAFNCELPPGAPLRWQWSLGYTFLWFKPAQFPPLATTGSATDTIPGALGQTNTSVLSAGSRDPGASAAFRTTYTYWLKDPELFSLELNFFIMEQRSLTESFDSDVTGNPVLARPFYDAFANTENADPRALPGVLRGTMFDSLTTRLMGAEASLKWHANNHFEGSHFNFFLGARWLRLDERYRSQDTVTFLSDGSTNTFSDTFTTYNQFFGGQMGTEWQYRLGRFVFSLTGKLAIGPNDQTIKIRGQTTINDVTNGFSIVDNSQGLFAQPTNVGDYRARTLAVLSEFGVKFHFDVSDHIRLNMGYTYFSLNRTVRPGDAIDRNINIQVPGAPLSEPFSPGPPSFRQSTFSAQMIDLGLEFRF